MPVSQCSTCSVSISRTNPGIVCQGHCDRHYHLKCVKLPSALGDLQSDSGVVWRCKDCATRPGLSTGDSAKLLQELVGKVNTVMSDLAALRSIQSGFTDSLNFFGAKIDDFTAQMEDVNKLSKKVCDLQQEVADVREESLSLRTEVEALQQESRKNNIELCGIPEKKSENIVSIIKKLGTVVGTQIDDKDVVASHRVARFNKGPDAANYPKNIVIKFASLSKKNEFLGAAKLGRNRGLKACDVGFEQETRVFVNEHLSPYYKVLHKRARDFCKRSGFKYCWIKEMKIFIKKEDNSRAFHIANEQVLSSLSN